ncbi:MAG TPA: HAD family hydrolase [Gemmatimonadales bacterium]|nr:HAD family hydrolase [Gemmatimonadales bacterium]
MKKHYLLASDFDQTLSFDDSGSILADLISVDGYDTRVGGLSRLNLVQQGAELAYLLRHDPDFRRVTRGDLVEVGRRVRLKRNVPLLTRLLREGIDGHKFDFYVISAAPEEVVLAALHGIVAPDHIIGTQFEWDAGPDEIRNVVRAAAGFGKVAAVESLREKLGLPRDQVIYVGDGQSDIPVMLHVNGGDGFTIAASEAREISHIAKRTVISDDALSVLVPILEDILKFGPVEIRAFFESQGLVIQEWDRVRTDWLTIREGTEDAAA